MELGASTSLTHGHTSILTSPATSQFIENYNKDVDFENEQVLQMDNVVQIYSDEEDEMIIFALGLASGVSLKGAVPFREFKTIFSSTKFLKGYYNLREGGIYAHASYTIRGDHSRVAAR